MELIDLIAFILATYRVSSLIVDESGPFGIFQKLREFTGIIHDEEGEIACVPNNVIANLCSCLWCMSIWTAIILYIVWWLTPIPIYILAASAGVMIIDNVRK